MQVSYDEGVANRIGPESCAVAREGHVATPKGARALLCTLAAAEADLSLRLALRGRRSQLSYHLVPGPPRQVIPAFNGRRPKWQVLP
jgi:hypothetical protein